MALPKIKLGSSRKKSYIPLDHDITTTSDFGFIQPTLIREMLAGSSAKLRSRSLVRLAPLPCPTIGRIKVKSYAVSIPINEVFEGFDYMIAGEAINSFSRNYIPQSADYVTTDDIKMAIAGYSLRNLDRVSGTSLNLSYDTMPFLQPYYLAPDLSPSNIKTEGATSTFIDFTPVPVGYSIDNETVFHTNTEIVNNRKYLILDALGCLQQYNSDTNYVRNAYFASAPTPSLGDIIPKFNSQSNIVTNIYEAGYKVFADAYHSDFYHKLNFLDEGFSEFNTVTLTLKDSEGNDVSVVVPILAGACWTRRGQRLKKVLDACGIDWECDAPFELNKVYAYYKAWFDLFNPGRDKQWKETTCYSLIHQYYDYGVTQHYLFDNANGAFDYNTTLNTEDFFTRFIYFLTDLTYCFYTEKVDNITAITPKPQLKPLSNNSSLEDTNFVQGVNRVDNMYIRSSEASPYGVVSPANTGALNGLVVRGMLAIYNRVNKNSVIGSKISDYLKDRYGYTIPETNIVGYNEYMVDVNGVVSTASTESAELAEYAGYGVEQNDGNVAKFDFDRNSYLIQLYCIVPQGGYVQSVPRPHIFKNDFYHSEFDSLGMQAVKLSEFVGRNQVSNGDGNTVFGFLPRYFDYKIQNSRHAGDFALPRVRDVVLPYSLDKIFAESDIDYTSLQISPSSGYNIINKQSFLRPSELLRYIGMIEDYGNFNRIFYDTTGTQDNFVLHIVNSFDYYAPMLPVSESYGTFDEQSDDSVTNVEKS